jgi:hypothetical protein
MITKRTELRLLARTHTRMAVAVLVGIARSNAAPLGARIAAANSLLDRGWGRPTQMLAGDGDSIAFRITEIVNDIVDPSPIDDMLVIAEPRLAPQLGAVTDAAEAGKAEREDDPGAT